MKSAPLLHDNVVIGNRYDKYGSRNPLVRRLVAGFDRGLFELLGEAGPVGSVLEVGCGEGHVTAKLANFFPGARVLGTDFAPAIVEIARREHQGLEFQSASIYDVATLGEWDLVVAAEVFEHLDHPARALRAVAAVARRAIVVTVPREPLWRVLNLVRGQYWPALGNTDGHVQHWSRGALVRFLAREVDVVTVRTPLPWTQALCRPRRSAPA
jgi:2-polyprenyl-3-methyl-5-hydroxy-6-metoxy-1,4-benzoquinol methylase